MDPRVLLLILFCLFRNIRCQAPVCNCVGRNTCFQNLTFDGTGSIDIRIVSPADTTTPQPAPPPTSAPGNCPAGYDLCCSGPNVVGCGLRYNIPPVAGIVPSQGQSRYASYPWQAIIYTSDNSYVGGGALINTNNVITAAHKVVGRTPASIKVRMGEWNASSLTEPYPTQDSIVSAIIVHPNYNPNNLFNDIAVLQLATPINLDISLAIDTICMPPININFDNMRCLVAGWGKDAFTGNLQSVQKEVEVPVIPYADCQSKLRNTRLGPLFVLDATSFMCAGGEAKNDACVGDGGSALACIVGGRYYLAGLVSWGIGCGDPGVPGVYVKLPNYTTWVLNNTK